MRRGPQVLIYTCCESLMRFNTDDCIDVLAVAEEQQARNRSDAETGSRSGSFIDVELGDRHTALVLLGQALDGWSEQPAGCTPGSPKIHEG